MEVVGFIQVLFMAVSSKKHQLQNSAHCMETELTTQSFSYRLAQPPAPHSALTPVPVEPPGH